MNGAYPIINYFLVNDLRQIDLWDESTAQYLSANDGSLKGFTKYAQSKTRQGCKSPITVWGLTHKDPTSTEST